MCLSREGSAWVRPVPGGSGVASSCEGPSTWVRHYWGIEDYKLGTKLDSSTKYLKYISLLQAILKESTQYYRVVGWHVPG